MCEEEQEAVGFNVVGVLIIYTTHQLTESLSTLGLRLAFCCCSCRQVAYVTTMCPPRHARGRCYAGPAQRPEPWGTRTPQLTLLGSHCHWHCHQNPQLQGSGRPRTVESSRVARARPRSRVHVRILTGEMSRRLCTPAGGPRRRGNPKP